MKLIDVASEAGADAIKFQTFKAEKVISRYAQKAEYQKRSTDASESQLDMVRKLELDEAWNQMNLKPWSAPFAISKKLLAVG
jgi:N,N'-diacetyllegionaminate synthase